MLAEHRHEVGFRIVEVTPREVAINADPVHLTTNRNLALPDNGDVILCLTGNHAGVAAHASS